MKKLIVWLAAVLLLTGCSQIKGQKSGTEYYTYYTNKEGTALIQEIYTPIGQTTEEIVEELVENFSKDPEAVEYKKIKPSKVNILRYSIDNQQISMYFDDTYKLMNPTTEVLFRAAVVRTLTQISNIDCVAFFVNDQPLMDRNDQPIGLMTAETFVENSGKEINSYQRSELHLYFANASGDKLVMEKRDIVYSTNISMEKLILEQLIKGPEVKKNPEEQKAYPTIPADTKLIGVSFKDGICYVNLDSRFINSSYEVTEEVPIYSIVNSLSEIPNVNKVQISIDGKTDMTYREKIKFTTMFERNLDMLETGGSAGA